MTYQRVVRRNDLEGGYDNTAANPLSLIRGDLRRFETDARDPWHIARYAKLAGVTDAQAKLLLDALFGDVELPVFYGEIALPVREETPVGGIVKDSSGVRVVIGRPSRDPDQETRP